MAVSARLTGTDGLPIEEVSAREDCSSWTRRDFGFLCGIRSEMDLRRLDPEVFPNSSQRFGPWKWGRMVGPHRGSQSLLSCLAVMPFHQVVHFEGRTVR